MRATGDRLTHGGRAPDEERETGDGPQPEKRAQQLPRWHGKPSSCVRTSTANRGTSTYQSGGRIRIRIVAQPPDVAREFGEGVVELMIAVCQEAHTGVGNSPRIQLAVCKRHRVVISAVVQEDGHAAW